MCGLNLKERLERIVDIAGHIDYDTSFFIALVFFLVLYFKILLVCGQMSMNCVIHEALCNRATNLAAL